MIEFKEVNKVFHKKNESTHALKDVSFTIEERDIFGVIGYSGAGKSTLLRLVNQLERATSGQVIVNTHDLDTYNKKELRKVKKDIGMIFQHFNLLNSANVFKNVAMPLILSKKPKKEIEEKVSEMLKFVGLEDKRNQYPDELSGGQKQRVAIARALVTNPKILLCDEATSALDPATTDSILKLLKNVNQTFGVTILLITHEMSVIQQICNRVAVMEDGAVVELGTVKDVFSQPQTETAKDFVSTVINTEPSKALREAFNSRETQNYTDYKLFLEAHQITQPFITQLAEAYDLDVNILFSSMSTIQEETVCYLWLRFEHDAKFRPSDVESYFAEKGIQYEEVHD
ncbi:methionine ABC transporter ATP-binding protein [Staphylococcus sp. SQ8-PEA]|uniref:Methionine ABC transporter ATP-binding protein n=1 Tax=Staphylococcus marylandisciuri TaxID=2981529 RepID=A0ABT2QQS8_9STAP|nr:methionine ABC transporter ATP-binding protein [Staphylococcus marylandisciuri]MCU5746303.1 methionine ABC transporter ATP-binding protein [Staphylococcus marylandisciuri]